MAANIEQIFQDFILNKIREIEDQHGDNGPAEDPEPRGDDGEVAQRASAEPHAQGGEAAGEPQHKHKKHKKHKSKKRKKKKKRKKGTGDDEEDEEESSTESGAESDGGGAKHQSSAAVPGQVNEEQDQDDKSKRHKGHASAKKKKKKRRKDAEKSSSDSDSESGSKHKEGGSSARHREALPDIIPKQDGSKKGGGGGERDGRARHRSRSRSRSHSRSARRGHRSRSRSRRRRSRTRSRSRSRPRRRSRTASRSRSSRSRSARRSRRSRSRSPRRRRSRSKTQSPSRRRRSPSRDRGSGSNKDRPANKSTADVVRVKEERVTSSPSVVKEERISPPPHSDSTAAEALKTAGGWKPLPLLDVNSTASSSEKKGVSDGSSEVSSKGPLPAATKELTEASTESPQSADQRSNGSKTGREEQKAEDTKERAGSKRGTSSATSQSSPTRSGSREKDRSAVTDSSRPRAPEDPSATAGKAKSPPAKKRTRASKSPVSQKKKDGKSSSKKKKKSKSKSRSQSRSRKKKSRSRSRSPSRRKRSRTKSRSRSPSRRSRRSRSRSGSRGRRRGAYSLSQRDRWKREPSHSPVLILRKNRSPPRKKRSNSKSPSRITELDKEQLLEIAKANAAAMCAKAGMPIPDNLRPRMPPQQPMPMPLPAMAMNAALASMTAATMTAALSGMGALASLPPLPSITNKPPPGPPQQNLAALEEVKRKVAKQANSISIKEFTEKCKMIVDSKGELPVAKPHVSDEEDEGKPFGGSALKETKAISFSIGNMSVRPAVRSDAGMAKEFPVSSGSQHRKKEGDTPSAYGDWVPVEKQTADKTKASAVAAAAAAAAASAGSKATPAVPAATTAPSSGEAASATVTEPTFVPATDSVFPEPPQQPVDISQAVTERIKAQRRLAENPYDVSAICMLSRAQEQVDAWAQSNTIPGLFTGSTGAQVLSSEELSNSGPQAWLKKDQFLRAAPVSGGVGEFLMRKMGWRTGEGLGRNREGTVEPIIIDFKIDRKGLVAEGEKPLKQTGGLVVTKDLMGKHPVSALIELCNKKRIMQPDFVMVHHSGPDHRKNFLFKVTVNGVDHQPQSASPNKKHAKAMAATVALQAMGEVPADGPGLYTGPVFTAASTGPLFST